MTDAERKLSRLYDEKRVTRYESPIFGDLVRQIIALEEEITMTSRADLVVIGGRSIDPLKVHCPTCGESPGSSCVDADIHAERVNRAKDVLLEADAFLEAGNQ